MAQAEPQKPSKSLSKRLQDAALGPDDQALGGVAGMEGDLAGLAGNLIDPRKSGVVQNQGETLVANRKAFIKTLAIARQGAALFRKKAQQEFERDLSDTAREQFRRAETLERSIADTFKAAVDPKATAATLGQQYRDMARTATVTMQDMAPVYARARDEEKEKSARAAAPAAPAEETKPEEEKPTEAAPTQNQDDDEETKSKAEAPKDWTIPPSTPEEQASYEEEWEEQNLSPEEKKGYQDLWKNEPNTELEAIDAEVSTATTSAVPVPTGLLISNVQDLSTSGTPSGSDSGSTAGRTTFSAPLPPSIPEASAAARTLDTNASFGRFRSSWDKLPKQTQSALIRSRPRRSKIAPGTFPALVRSGLLTYKDSDLAQTLTSTTEDEPSEARIVDRALPAPDERVASLIQPLIALNAADPAGMSVVQDDLSEARTARQASQTAGPRATRTQAAIMAAALALQSASPGGQAPTRQNPSGMSATSGPRPPRPGGAGPRIGGGGGGGSSAFGMPNPALGRAMELNSARSMDLRNDASQNDNPLGGDTQVSDSSLSAYGESGERSPLDIGQFEQGYGAAQIPEIEGPIAGGGYQETDMERAAKMQREKTSGQRAQEQLVGAGDGGSFMTAAPSGVRPISGGQAPQGGPARGPEGAGAETPEQADIEDQEAERAAELDQARNMQQAQQRQEAEQAETASPGRGVSDIKKNLKLVRNITEGGQAFSIPESLGTTLLTLLLQLNLQMLYKYLLKGERFGRQPKFDQAKDLGTLCADCGVCLSLPAQPPCIFFIAGLFALVALIKLYQDSIGLLGG